MVMIPKKAFGTLVFVALCFIFLLFSQGLGQWLAALFASSAPIIPYTTHIVLFQFKDSTSPIAIKEVNLATMS